ncbi:hypothetical protein [Enterovibrio baiacu]|uniref:ParE family toxin-like protein n=1 Tax=Enterovibrio baiacu TaxID=2491023 RepID=UPI003B84AA14
MTDSGVEFKGDRLPKCVYRRVRYLCDQLRHDCDAICREEGRRLRRNKHIVRFSLPRGYRLIVDRRKGCVQRYVCYSHSRYDKVIMQV